ncbi:MAG TPA: alpha/beta hydrolase fold domain-containing protein [Solirubrobacterales bacterium]|nr:alpha/beta hydrolase fold domain-containing protein [Solirubrobacterales bacterium]
MLTFPDRIVDRLALPLARRLEGDIFASQARLEAHIERRRRRPVDPRPPRGVRRAVELEVGERHGWPVFTATPRRGESAVSLVYLHGGAYVNEISRWHWLLIRELVEAVPARSFVPIYPLAPDAGAEDVVPRAAEIAGELIAAGGARPTILIGDSAGAGLAVATAIALRDRGSGQPSRLILLSPWVDATVSDPRQHAVAPRDRMLRPPGLAAAGRIYAGALAPDDPRVSPIHADLRGLAPMTIFSGTDDILDLDSRRLAEEARRAGVEVDLDRVDAAPHDFPLLPTRHGARARARIIEIIRAEGERRAAGPPAERA